MSQPPVAVDYIVSLSGGTGRAVGAGLLYHQGFAPRIILSAYSGQASIDEAESMLRLLGVPQQSILINDEPTSTWDEAQQIMQMLHQLNAHSAIIVTNVYHTRRARAVYEHLQNGFPIKLTFVAIPDGFDDDRWWEDSSGRQLVLDEYLKTGFYFLRYGVPF